MGSTEDGHEGTRSTDLGERRGGASDGEGGRVDRDGGEAEGRSLSSWRRCSDAGRLAGAVATASSVGRARAW